VDLLIKALPLIIEKVPNAYLVIIGPDGGEIKTVLELGKQLNVGKYFTWLGPKYDEEKFTAFAGTDVFVLPSDWEGYPVAIVEAMASGIPVITTNIRGPIEMIENGVTGLIIKKGNFEELAKSIIRVLSDDNFREKLSKNARDSAEKMYSPQKITERVLAIYNEVIERRSGK
jgi:glycosyltransferase involved in cell wall biosynthesis